MDRFPVSNEFLSHFPVQDGTTSASNDDQVDDDDDDDREKGANIDGDAFRNVLADSPPHAGEHRAHLGNGERRWRLLRDAISLRRRPLR